MCGYSLNSKLREANEEGEGARERGVEKKLIISICLLSHFSNSAILTQSVFINCFYSVLNRVQEGAWLFSQAGELLGLYLASTAWQRCAREYLPPVSSLVPCRFPTRRVRQVYTTLRAEIKFFVERLNIKTVKVKLKLNE